MQNVIEENAIELAHIINQYELERKYVLIISKFLKKDDDHYFKKLDKLRKDLKPARGSEYFLKYLKDSPTNTKYKWHRGDPIQLTPLSHHIHARYYRINPLDKHIGLPIPSIFSKQIPNTIRRSKYLYSLWKPFGYEFQQIIITDDMTFNLYDMQDPIYYGDGETPFYIKNKRTYPMSNLMYKDLYMAYISKS
jgi:hypothetical protein